MPAACTSSSTSFFLISGLLTSSTTKVSAGPKALHNTAFIRHLIYCLLECSTQATEFNLYTDK